MAVAAGSETPGSELSGMVWESHGDWHLNGSSTALRLGEAIPPGGLLTAGTGSPAHSMTVLLPDGQRMLCECYEAKTCAQGFRVPAITPPPAACGLGYVCRGQKRPVVTAGDGRDTLSPRRQAAQRWQATSRWCRRSTRRARSTIAPALRGLPPGQYALSITNGWATSCCLDPSSCHSPWIGRLARKLRKCG